MSWTLPGVLLTDLWDEPLQATSRTTDKLGHIDMGMVLPPLRTFVYCSFCPFLAYPIIGFHMFGFYRCVKTFKRREDYRQNKYTGRVYYGVQRREYEPRVHKLQETQIDDPQEIQHALTVTDGVRNQFVDDPTKKGRAYFVVEQRVMRKEVVFTAENYGWAVTSDVVRFLGPVLLAMCFHPSIKRMTVDIKLWSQGRLHWRQFRLPIFNFFKTYQELNQSLYRINVAKPQESTKKPWNHRPFV